ncbi:YihY/virulence factor BrkB family protein [Desulfococcaceae bacterium HSG9]|nr:YihY/virulence factor BrkB family protein [Desulfococcaceae bacterium HSG9]
MQNLEVLVSKFINFLRVGIWRIQIERLPRHKAVYIQLSRIFLLTTTKFVTDKCALKASALTYYTMLSIVPAAAMAFGIARGFGFEKLLKKELLEKFPGQEEITQWVIQFADSLLINTHSGMMAGIGLIILFWSVAKVLMNIEHAFNEIWESKHSRSVARKLSDYLAIVILCPVLLIASSSVVVYISTQMEIISGKIPILEIVSEPILFSLKFIPFVLVWLLFMITYYIMPVAKVNLLSALIAGVVAGTGFHLLQFTYIRFQVGVAQYNAIYGSFAALPLFMVWLHLSWHIVLLGAQISYSVQHADNYEFEPDRLQMSFYLKKLFALQIIGLITRKFAQGEKPLTAVQIAKTLDMPLRLVCQIITLLSESEIITSTHLEEDNPAAFQPACDISRFTLSYIIDALEHKGSDSITVAQTEHLQKLIHSLDSFSETVAQSSDNQHLQDL